MDEEALSQIIALKPKREVKVNLEAELLEGDPRAQDPVCRRFINLRTMTSPTSRTISTVEHDGTTYYFCSPSCQGAFERHPGAYVR
jgi:YHS domain-containing protein